jgi:hypothetical protein
MPGLPFRMTKVCRLSIAIEDRIGEGTRRYSMPEVQNGATPTQATP